MKIRCVKDRLSAAVGKYCRAYHVGADYAVAGSWAQAVLLQAAAKTISLLYHTCSIPGLRCAMEAGYTDCVPGLAKMSTKVQSPAVRHNPADCNSCVHGIVETPRFYLVNP